MATFCKISRGGFNVEHVVKWYWSENNKDLTVSFTQRENIVLFGQEAKRMLSILEGVCIFDSTHEVKK